MELLIYFSASCQHVLVEQLLHEFYVCLSVWRLLLPSLTGLSPLSSLQPCWLWAASACMSDCFRYETCYCVLVCFWIENWGFQDLEGLCHLHVVPLRPLIKGCLRIFWIMVYIWKLINIHFSLCLLSYIHPKIYSPKYCSKPRWLSVLSGTKGEIFNNIQADL